MRKKPRLRTRITAAMAIALLALSSMTIGIAGMVSSWTGPIQTREQIPYEWMRHVDL